MLVIKAIVEGITYDLPDFANEKSINILYNLRKGMPVIFRSVEEKFHGQTIEILWNDDIVDFIYPSPTIAYQESAYLLSHK